MNLFLTFLGPYFTFIISNKIILDYFFISKSSAYKNYYNGLSLSVFITLSWAMTKILDSTKPTIYIFLIPLVTAVVIIIIKIFKQESLVWTNKLSKIESISVTVIIINIFYVIYYDALRFISPSHSDTLNSYWWFQGHIVNEFRGHFPGLSIVGFVPHYLRHLSMFELNFIASSFLLTYLLFCNLTLSRYLSKYGLIIFNLVIISPLFYPLLYMRLGIHSSALFFYFFTLLITFLMKRATIFKINIKNIGTLFIIISGATISAPHLFIMIIPSFILTLFILSFLYHRYNFFLRWAVIFIFMSFTNLLIFHLLNNDLVSSIVNPLTEPENYISIVNPLTEPENYINITDDIDSLIPGTDYKQVSLINQVYFLGLDYLSIKHPIRSPWNDIYSLGAYVILIFMIIGLIYSYKRKSLKMVAVTSFTLPLNISVISGILEFSYLKGRSGWLLFICLAIMVSILGENLIQLLKKYVRSRVLEICVVAISLLSLLLSILYPPMPFRNQDEQPLLSLRNLVKEVTKNVIHLRCDLNYCNLASSTISLNQYSDQKIEQYDIIVLNNEDKIPDLKQSGFIQYGTSKKDLVEQEIKDEIVNRIRENRIIRFSTLRSGKFVVYESRNKYEILINTNFHK